MHSFSVNVVERTPHVVEFDVLRKPQSQPALNEAQPDEAYLPHGGGAPARPGAIAADAEYRRTGPVRGGALRRSNRAYSSRDRTRSVADLNACCATAPRQKGLATGRGSKAMWER